MNKTIIIAEAGVNHNGSLQLALKLIEAAAAAGADAVKFQTFQADQLVSSSAGKAEYQKKLTNATESQYEMLRRLQLSLDDHFQLVQHCRKHGISFMSTPFDELSLRFLTDELGLDLLKFSSGDLTNLPLILKAARKGCKVILSTGMATLVDVELALATLAFGYIARGDVKPSEQAFRQAYCSSEGQQELTEKVTILHCTTDYPTAYDDVHLNKMITLRRTFQLPTGYSDHTMGTEIPVAAVALGASVIEKHFTLDRSMEGPDHQSSIEPSELAHLVQQIRHVEDAFGIPNKIPAISELKNMEPSRKSIVAAKDIEVGETFEEMNMTVKRPGNGLPPSMFWSMIGRKANRAYKKDELIEW